MSLWCIIVCATLAQAGTQPAGTLVRSSATARTGSGATLIYETGALFVPENRARPQGRTISIPYYRLRSTARKPAAPVFVLAGGPGDSWLRYFDDDSSARDEVLVYREVGDVVLFDQRGAGKSRPRLDCSQRLALPLDRPTTPHSYAAALRVAAAECRADWERAGVDLAAYNTRENAADVNALRVALGYDKINLVGGSYGSHLAFALLRYHRGSIARVVLDGVEGPDHTHDSAAGILEDLSRLANAAEKSASLRTRVPAGGLLAALAAVQRRLAANPVTVTIMDAGKAADVVVGAFDVQRAALDGAHERAALSWAHDVIDMYEGNYATLARRTLSRRRSAADSAMYYMMDCASGISRTRLDHLRTNAEELAAQALLGDLNLPYSSTCDVWNAPDAGSEFRSELKSDVPLLIFHGTWDLSTPFANARCVLPGFSNGALTAVEGGTHSAIYDLLQSWAPAKRTLVRFLRGQTSDVPASITLPAAQFSAHPGD
jgi:pimeloyl-ACP methyl ester carboxylesterase